MGCEKGRRGGCSCYHSRWRERRKERARGRSCTEYGRVRWEGRAGIAGIREFRKRVGNMVVVVVIRKGAEAVGEAMERSGAQGEMAGSVTQ
jgi:hypothetical protein